MTQKMKDIIMISFSAIIILCSLAWFALLMFVKIPAENSQIINIVSGVILSGGWTQILNYWFGSSKGSADKNQMLYDSTPKEK